MKNLFRYLAFATPMLLLFAVIANAQSSSSPLQNEIEIRGDVTVPTGEANFSGTTDSSQTIDFKRDFDFNNKVGFSLHYIHRSKNAKHKFQFLYSRDNWDKTATATRSVTFLGQTYVANASAELGLTYRTFLARYAYRWGNEKIRFGPMIDMGVINTSVSLTGTTNQGTRTGDASTSKFAATIGYDLEATPSPKVTFFHNLGAIVFQGEHFMHVEAGVKYFVASHFGLEGGYRYARDKMKGTDPNYLLVRQHGPFFGGVIRF